MIDINEIITTHLVWEHGYVIYPKGDGRVEIPQIFIKQLDWSKNKEVFAQSKFGEIVITKNKLLNYDSIKFTNNRIRISLGILKKANLDKKSLYVISNSNYLIIRTYVDGSNDISNRVYDFISTLNDVQKNQLLSIFVDKIINKVETNLILLDQAKPMVFRIVGPAFTFPAMWCNKNIKICADRPELSSQLYLIPGINIQKQNLESGFLLVSENTFSNIKTKIVEKMGITMSNENIPIELVLFYDVFVDGKFKVYINPPTPIDQSVIENTKKLCSNASNFINKTFAKEKLEDFPERFPILTKQTME